MKVLHVVTALEGGGAERFVSSLMPELVREDARCAVMTICPTAIPDAIRSARDLEVIEIRRRSRFDGGFLGRMIAAMRSWRPDVVHTHMHHGTYWGRFAALAAGTPIIVRTEHHPCAPQAPIPGTAFCNRLLNKSTSAIVTFSQGQGQYLARAEGFDPRKLVVIPNGIKHGAPPLPADSIAARDRLGIRPGVFAVFVLGNLRYPKNQALAIEAVAALNVAQRKRMHLFFAGDGCDREALQSLVTQRSLDDVVTFLGYRNDIGRILPAARLLLMTSLTEGMPLAMLEAMSIGVPIVSTPWNGAADLLGGGELGAVASDHHPATLAREIARVMDDPSLARAAAARAQVAVRRDYDIGATARLHRALYDRLVPGVRAA